MHVATQQLKRFASIRLEHWETEGIIAHASEASCAVGENRGSKALLLLMAIPILISRLKYPSWVGLPREAIAYGKPTAAMQLG